MAAPAGPAQPHPPLHQQLKLVSDLDGLPLGAVRRLSHALNLTWPDWLEAADDPQPCPALPDTLNTTAGRATQAFDDTGRLHALLALVLGQSLTHQQIADVLDWPLQRVQTALAHLVPTSRGMQLNLDDTTAELTIAPRALPAGARDRLQQLLLRQHPPRLWPTSPSVSALTKPATRWSSPDTAPTPSAPPRPPGLSHTASETSSPRHYG
ncbi:hypothetical protein [Nonomuraea sp. NPDC049480]|uniref:hypothetical protein n=1 Tax=Nonomuraea sp. NPDC049480 TaxID=3364353 RepID=UPI0037BD4E3A